MGGSETAFLIDTLSNLILIEYWHLNCPILWNKMENGTVTVFSWFGDLNCKSLDQLKIVTRPFAVLFHKDGHIKVKYSTTLKMVYFKVDSDN